MNAGVYKLFSALITGSSKRLKKISVNHSSASILILTFLQKENYIRFFDIQLKNKKYFINIHLPNNSSKLN